MTIDLNAVPPIGPGSIVGRYKVISHLAYGGMSEIFLARDTAVSGISRNVVLKCIHPEILEDTAMVELFIDEIRIVARLSHENIAHVYDFGESKGTYFMAMEHVEGLSLRQLALGQLPDFIPIEHLVKIGADVAQALYYAHNLKGDDGRSLGIIHRDVSPQNILVSFDGQVKLLDFGVAKAADQLHHTQVGTLRGKCSYMAPEQCLELPMDHRVDIFALGIVLYELLSGRRLFRRETAVETIRAICTPSVPRPSATRPDIPKALDDAVLKALACRPKDRYQSADEMSVALTHVAHEEGLISNPVFLGRFVRSVLEQEPDESSVSPQETVGERPVDEEKAEDSAKEQEEITEVDAIDNRAPTPTPTPLAHTPALTEDTTSVNNLLPLGAPTTVVSSALSSIGALEPLYPIDPATDIDVPTLVSDPPREVLLAALLESDFTPEEAALELETALSLENSSSELDIESISLDSDIHLDYHAFTGLEPPPTTVDQKAADLKVVSDLVKRPSRPSEPEQQDASVAEHVEEAIDIIVRTPAELGDSPVEDLQVPELYPEEDETDTDVWLIHSDISSPPHGQPLDQVVPLPESVGAADVEAIEEPGIREMPGPTYRTQRSRTILLLALAAFSIALIFGIVFIATLLLSGCYSR